MELFKSKKFQMAAVGIIVVIVTNFIPGIDKGDLTEIVGLIMAYIVGQGLADFGKEAEKVSKK